MTTEERILAGVEQQINTLRQWRDHIKRGNLYHRENQKAFRQDIGLIRKDLQETLSLLRDIKS